MGSYSDPVLLCMYPDITRLGLISGKCPCVGEGHCLLAENWAERLGVSVKGHNAIEATASRYMDTRY